MKYKVGDKFRVRSDLVANGVYGGNVFAKHMIPFKGTQITIKEFYANKYIIEEDYGIWHWTDEMLEPVEEPFNVGDVVYDGNDIRPLTILRKAWVVCYQDKTAYEHLVEERVLSKTRTLQKITREELALKGYELVE